MGHWQFSILDIHKFWSEPWLLGTLIELDQVFVFLWHYKTSASIPNIWTSLEVIWYDHVLISETFSSDSNLSRTVFKKVIDYPTGQQMPLVRATWRNWGHSVIVEPFSKIIITQVFQNILMTKIQGIAFCLGHWRNGLFSTAVFFNLTLAFLIFCQEV